METYKDSIEKPMAISIEDLKTRLGGKYGNQINNNMKRIFCTVVECALGFNRFDEKAEAALKEAKARIAEMKKN